MPLPRNPARRFEELKEQVVSSGLCCIQTAETSQEVVGSEPVSARAMSEVRFTPRTPRGPPPVDQLLDLERRLQNSLGGTIASVMEQQYERLSGEVLDILRRSQQKRALRSQAGRATGRANGLSSKGVASMGLARGNMKGTSVKYLQPVEKDVILKTPDGMPPLLQLGKNMGDAVQVSMKDSPDVPVLVSPRATRLAQSSNESAELRNTQQNGHESCDDFLSMPQVNGAETGGQVESTMSASMSPDSSTRKSARFRSTVHSTLQKDGSMLADLSMTMSTSTKQREKRVQAKMKSKFKSRVNKNSQTGELVHPPCGTRILENPFFDSCCAFAITLNAVLIGFSVEHLTTHDEETGLLIALGHACNAFFFLELVFRMSVLRLSYFTSEDRIWNLFDFMLVAFSVIDVAMWLIMGESGTGAVGSTLKIVKMLRIVRIFRVFRFFRELSLLALMIMDSLKSLIWALFMLTIIIYVFAICFTQNATEFAKALDKSNLSTKDSDVLLYFGTLPKTIYCLVNSILGGLSWGVVSDALLYMDAFSAMLYFFYICFCLLAVLNIITGVFVENAVETAKTEQTFVMEKEWELREKLLSDMKELFSEMDEDGSGAVSFEELQSYFDDQRVQTYFHALGLDPTDAERLFRLIDLDGSGEVMVDEFLDGCLRLKGEARSIDVNHVVHLCKQIVGKLENLEWDTERALRLLKQGDRDSDNEVPRATSKTQDSHASTAAFFSSKTRVA